MSGEECIDTERGVMDRPTATLCAAGYGDSERHIEDHAGQGAGNGTLDSAKAGREAGIDKALADWAIGSLAAVFGLPFDARLHGQRFPSACSFPELRYSLEALGLSCTAHARLPRLHRWRFPCLLESESGAGLLLATGHDGDGVIVFEPGTAEPRTVQRKAFSDHFSGRMIECLAPMAEMDDPDNPVAQRFGLRWFLPLLRRDATVWRDVLLASLLLQLIALGTPLLTQIIIDKVVVHHSNSTLLAILCGLLIFLVFNAVLAWVRQSLVIDTGNRVDARLCMTVFEHLFKLPLDYFDQRSTGVIAARLQAVENVREFVTSSLVTLALDIPFIVIFAAIMFWYSVPLTLIVLGIITLIVLLSLLVAPMLRQRLDQQFLFGARKQAFVNEHLAGMETVKSLQMEPGLVHHYRDHLACYLEAGARTRHMANTYNVVAGMLDQFMTLAVLGCGAWIVMHGTLAPAGNGTSSGQTFTIGMLVAFQMFANKLSQPVMRLVGLWQQLQQTSIAIRRLADILDAPAEYHDMKSLREPPLHCRIEVVNLAFRYDVSRPYLYQNLNLCLEAGKTTVLTGPSGSGKSTLARLLQGFMQPSGGRILVDGVDIGNLPRNELRVLLGVVPQETTLFSGTLHDNLVAGNPAADFHAVVRACQQAGIHEVIQALPKGYRTEIGERGVGLSGGQKQRVAIARALLKQPRLLIFDEATSALDQATAEQFAATVNSLRGTVSMLFITHQIPKGLLVDQVVRIGTVSKDKAVQGNTDTSRVDERRMDAKGNGGRLGPEPQTMMLPDQMPEAESEKTTWSSDARRTAGSAAATVNLADALAALEQRGTHEKNGECWRRDSSRSAGSQADGIP